MLLGLPGSLEAFTLDELRTALREYDDIGETELRENLSVFIKEIAPVAEEARVLLVTHPDDPPWPLLGLPRVVRNKSDLEQIMKASVSHANGITFCTGSLGAGCENDLVDMAGTFAERINFIHLRNVTRNREGDFIEDSHLEGDHAHRDDSLRCARLQASTGACSLFSARKSLVRKDFGGRSARTSLRHKTTLDKVSGITKLAIKIYQM